MLSSAFRRKRCPRGLKSVVPQHHPVMVAKFHELGYPLYVLNLLGIAKVLGVAYHKLHDIPGEDSESLAITRVPGRLLG
jgi:hypothetical protein